MGQTIINTKSPFVPTPFQPYPLANKTIIQTAYSISFNCLCALYKWKHKIYNIFFCVMCSPFVQTVLLCCTQLLWDQKPLCTVIRFSVLTQGPAQIQVGHIWLHLALALDISVGSPELPPGLGGRYTLLPWSAPLAFPHSYLLLWLLLYVLPYETSELFTCSHK